MKEVGQRSRSCEGRLLGLWSRLDAVRRLNGSYPMLDRAKLLLPVGDLLAQHLVDGREAVAVIHDLEAFYAAAYAAFLKSQ